MVRSFEIDEFTTASATRRDDLVAVEEPMETRIVFGPAGRRAMRQVAVTMRTPGHDEELAAGFLYTEGLLSGREAIRAIETSGTTPDGVPTGNIVRVELEYDVPFDPQVFQRNFLANSSCGVCGKASLEALHAQGGTPVADDHFVISARSIMQAPDALRKQQTSFARTGGIHGTGLLDAAGHIQLVREDIGRHNAVDKVIGRCFLDGRIPLDACAMVVSGRVSFEIVQKALMARIPVLIAVGAPSSLAIDIARASNLTLAGFASGQRFNIYSAPQRIGG